MSKRIRPFRRFWSLPLLLALAVSAACAANEPVEDTPTSWEGQSEQKQKLDCDGKDALCRECKGVGGGSGPTCCWRTSASGKPLECWGCIDGGEHEACWLVP